MVTTKEIGTKTILMYRRQWKFFSERNWKRVSDETIVLCLWPPFV